MQISFVPAESVDSVWMALRPEILKALSAHGSHKSESDYLASLKSNQCQMWVAHVGPNVGMCAVVSIENRTDGKAIVVDILAGKDFKSLMTLGEEMLKKYKEQVGATTIEAICRPGFEKTLPNWKKKAVIMELKNG